MAESHADNPEVHHETSDVNIRAVLGFGFGLIVAGIFIHFAIWLLFMFFESREARVAPEFPLAAGQENRLPPEPRLQKNPRQELRDMKKEEDDILTSYGWVDQNGGVVRMPIDEAMKLLVERGLPARPQDGKK
jgi:hypothetical protein